MLDLSKYQSIGAALKDALEEFANEMCLIEADREREKERLTYRDFKKRAHPLAKALQDAGFSAVRSRQHHHDESVQVADFRLRDFLRGWRFGSARLQTHAGRTMAIAQALGCPNPDHRVPHLAAIERGSRPCRRSECAHRSCDRSARRMPISSALSAGKNFTAAPNQLSFRARARTWRASSIPQAPAAAPRAA